MSLHLHLIPLIFLFPLVSFFSPFICQVQGTPSISTTSELSFPHQRPTRSDWAVIRPDISSDGNATAKGFLNKPTGVRYVLLINGTADDSFAVNLSLEKDRLPSDYNFSFVTKDVRIIDTKSDISLSQTESGSILNATIAIDFHNFPGLTTLTMEVHRTSDDSLYDLLPVHFLVAGTVIYNRETNNILSGEGRSLVIPSYKDIYEEPHRDFGVFTQYLNGSDSNTLAPRSDDAGILAVEMSNIVPQLMFFAGQVLWDESTCTIDNGLWVSEQLVLKPGCGMGFGNAYGNKTKYDGARFALDLQKNRAGKFGIFFVWNGFTFSSEFADEEYTTYIIVEIVGQPPAVVRRIEPANPFDKTGGEELYVETINTADANMSSFNVNGVPFKFILGTRSIIKGPDDFYETARFLTMPGSGLRLPWTITATRKVNKTETEVPFIDETGFLFSYNSAIPVLKTLTPEAISEKGEIRVVLSGAFPGFNPNASGHNVVIGTKAVDKSRLVRVSESDITIIVPQRSTFGAGWVFNVSLEIGDVGSNQLSLEFNPSFINLRGQVFGSSFDDEAGQYVLNSCGNSTFIVTLVDQKETTEIEFEWKMLDAAGLDLLALANASGIVKTTDTLLLPNDFIPYFDQQFSILGTVRVGIIEATHSFVIKKSTGYVIGVTLVQPENRTISVPAVNLRIIAKIEIPPCVQNFPDELVYEWELENNSQAISPAGRIGRAPLSARETAIIPEHNRYIFSFQNTTGTFDGELTPTRLGREFIVPREYIEHGFHRVRLKVRGNDTGVQLQGADSTGYTILKSPLVAKIGAGQFSHRVSDTEEMTMSAVESFDPDIIVSSNSSIGLKYLWSCTFSLYDNFSITEPCKDLLLPQQSKTNSKFIIGPGTLQDAAKRTTEGVQGNVYIRYQVAISKDLRSAAFSQKIILAQAAGKKMSRYHRIEIVNSRDELVNLDFVEFWDDVIIRPVATASTTWRFRLELPRSERSRFLTSGNNLISRSGYYITSGNSAPGFQQRPLGIQADRLQANQIYQFLITFQESGRLADDVSVQLKTAEVPDLVFPSLSTWNGTTSTVFRATATTSFQGNSMFSYQFYLLEIGRNSREYCIDGCTGIYTVRFQVSKPGNYSLQCRLLAANGKKLLAVKNNSKIIIVSGQRTGANFSEFDDGMMHDYRLGDDGSVAQKGFYVSESIYQHDGELVAMDDARQSDLCAEYTKKWAKISRHIITNELPNTPNARNYVILAANYARLQCVEFEETLYELLGIVDRSIAKTPQEEVLTTSTYSKLEGMPSVALEEDLRRFYNFTITRAASILAEGTTRSRIVSRQGTVNNLILDVMEQWIKHVTIAATSGQVCGWEGVFTLGTTDGEPDSSIVSTPGGSPLGQSVIHVAVNCNAEQGTSLKTPHATFEWCDAVYALSGGKRKLVTLAETFDFPYMSGVQGENRSETERIVMVDISTLDERNQLMSAITAESVVAAQAAEGRSSSKLCYQVGMNMQERAAVAKPSQKCWENRVFTMKPRKVYDIKLQTQLKRPFDKNAYGRQVGDILTTKDSKNSTSFVIAETNELGLYGAVRASCIDPGISPLHSTGTILAGILLGILLLVLVITALTYMLVTAIVGGAVIEESEAFIPHFGYVERDYFGRKDIRINVGDHSPAGSAELSQRSVLNNMGAATDEHSSAHGGGASSAIPMDDDGR